MMKQLWSANELWSIEVDSIVARRVTVYIGSHDSSSMIRMPREVAEVLHAALTDVLYPQNTEAPNGVCEGSRAEHDASPHVASPSGDH